MAYRTSRQSGQRRKNDRLSKNTSKKIPLRIPVIENKLDNQVKNLNLQVPSSSSVLNDPTNCMVMQWGSGMGSGGLPIGPDIQLNIEPPIVGPFSGQINTIEFAQYWGVQNAAGSYFVPASGSINISYSLKINASSTGINTALSNFELITIVPGMYMHTIRLVGKARLRKWNGTVIPLHFEHKNSLPLTAFIDPPAQDGGFGIGIGGGGFGSGGYDSGSYPIYQELPGNPNYIHFFVHDINVPLDKCFWKVENLVNHAPGQSPGYVYPNPAWPFPYGLDANFGLDMNNSYPVTNFFEYGDAIEIENIDAIANPFWGFNQCSYSIGVDTDGDGVTDDFFGNTIDPNTGVPIGPGNAGGNLQTLLPSETKLLEFIG